MLIQVHDELIFEVPNEEIDSIKKKFQDYGWFPSKFFRIKCTY